MDVIFSLAITAFILFICFIWGKVIEKQHYRYIIEQEEQLRHILIFNERVPPEDLASQSFSLVAGSAVMSSDYFKATIAALKSIFGGRLSSYEAMMDLGRRTAIVRMKQEAAKVGAQFIFNVRMETATLNEANGSKSITCAEFFAYGTAWFPNQRII